jgi:hypothetical protein
VDPAADLHRAYLRVLAQQPPVRSADAATDPPSHLGTGMYRCGVCPAGTPLHVHTSGRRAVYRCPVAPHLVRSVALVDRQVVGAVVARLSGPGAVGLLTRSPPNTAVDALRIEAAAIREALSRMAADTAIGLLDHDQLLAATAAGRARLDTIDEAIRWAEPAPSLAALIGSADVASTWRQLPMSEQRRILAALVVVTVAPTARRVRGLNPPAVWIAWR